MSTDFTILRLVLKGKSYPLSVCLFINVAVAHSHLFSCFHRSQQVPLATGVLGCILCEHPLVCMVLTTNWATSPPSSAAFCHLLHSHSLEVTVECQWVRTSSFLLSLLGVVSGTHSLFTRPCTHPSPMLMGPIFSAWKVDSKSPAHSHSNCCFFLGEHITVLLCMFYVIICLIAVPSPTRWQFSYQRGSYPWILITVFLHLA